MATLDARTGVIAGLARHGRRKGPIEVIDRAEISVDGGIAGDWRGTRRPGSSGRRQVTLMERGDWDAALAELESDVASALPWWERRSNMLIDGLDLPQVPGARLLLGASVVIEVTCETNPCNRMDALAPGLFAALLPDWRGGVCGRVLNGGHVAIGDVIRIEKP
ncbi:MAG: MOSC domain-containing protein [Janthinobacterium lividum]